MTTFEQCQLVIITHSLPFPYDHLSIANEFDTHLFRSLVLINICLRCYPIVKKMSISNQNH